MEFYTMTKKAIFFDLDNTIYPVSSIADRLFAPLFHLLASSGELNRQLEDVKQELMRKPFQLVATRYGFSPALTESGIELLQHTQYDGPIEPFEDYNETKNLPAEKFLVTTGFRLLQQSKIDGMGIEKDFAEIFIVDPEKETKKAVFSAILKQHNYRSEDVLVVGDDPDSELKAAHELGLDAVLYDPSNLHLKGQHFPRIRNYKELHAFL